MKKMVILVSGKISSGKNTFTDFLKEEIETQYKIPVATDYFAKLLKDMCKDAFRPLTDHLNKIFDAAKCPLLITKDENWYENKNEITRHILQAVGTEIVRTVNQSFWTDSFIKRTNERPELICLNSDCRFPSEIEGVEKAFHTITIRIERKLDREGSINEHASEKALDDRTDWDYLIHNDGTLEELKESVKYVASCIFHKGEPSFKTPGIKE